MLLYNNVYKAKIKIDVILEYNICYKAINKIEIIHVLRGNRIVFFRLPHFPNYYIYSIIVLINNFNICIENKQKRYTNFVKCM